MAVVVDAVVVVELVDVELSLLDQVVVADNNSGQWAHQAGVAREESEEARGILDDVPGGTYDTEEGDEEGGAENVDVFGAETGDVVGKRIGAGSDLVAYRRKHKGEAGEEFGRAGVELCDDGGHVPLKIAPNVGVSTGHKDAVALISLMIGGSSRYLTESTLQEFQLSVEQRIDGRL